MGRLLGGGVGNTLQYAFSTCHSHNRLRHSLTGVHHNDVDQVCVLMCASIIEKLSRACRTVTLPPMTQVLCVTLASQIAEACVNHAASNKSGSPCEWRP